MSRIAVALSGGVDSSVAAALLAEEGHEVVGFTLKVWDSSRCCSLEDVEDARRVARHLGIPFYVLDAHDEFESEVVNPFVEAYRAGLTPNPCILCNRRVKFRWLLSRVRALGCEALATGHYARLDGAPGARRLHKGVDPSKDQSYFLVPEEPDALDRLLFPLGNRTKKEAREIAADRGLPVAGKPESQDVCFVPDGDVPRFLEDRLGAASPGEIVDLEGLILGRHRGVYTCTVGQRKGLGLSGPEPHYVIRKDAATNRLVVGARRNLFAPALTARDPVWLGWGPPGGHCSVKIRSTASAVPCAVSFVGAALRVDFDEPQFGVAPGQMAVFYEGDRVLGGAWIVDDRRTEPDLTSFPGLKP